jgi:hypothetical protein
MDLSNFNWASVGASLLQAASTEEREIAAELLNTLLPGPEEQNAHTQRFFGASPQQIAGHSVESSDATVNTTPNTAASSILSNLKDSITQLLPLLNSKPTQQSPLLALHSQISTLFSSGPEKALFIFSKLQLHIAEKTYHQTSSTISIPIFSSSSSTDQSLIQSPPYSIDLWKSCKMTATLILLLASSPSPSSLFTALKSHSQSLGGLPTHSTIKTTPSASLPQAFQAAKRAATKDGKMTVLAVSLVDVHIFELAHQGKSAPYFSFAHVFTMGIGPEGVIIWQAWGKHGYRLDEYLHDGHGRVRDWTEVEQFVRDFDKLAAQKVSQLFKYDLWRIEG